MTERRNRWTIGEVDLARPVIRLSTGAGAAPWRILVRCGRRPIGWVTLEDPNDGIGIDALQAAIVAQLGGPIEDTATAAGVTADWSDGEPTPPISVVVCTRDRPRQLADCLATITQMDYPNYEVVVVDNASSPSAETAAIVANLPIRYVQEPRPGLDRARNRGIATAAHAIVAFTDDDVQVDSGWLRGIAAGFSSPDVMLVCGLVCPAELETEAQCEFELDYGGMGKGFRPSVWRAGDLSSDQLIAVHQLGVGANMAFRRQALDRLGGFDPALDVGTQTGGGGDLDAFHRTLISGGIARYEPTAVVWHHHRRDRAALRRQLRDNGRGFVAYLLTQWAAAGRPGAIRRASLARYALKWSAWLFRRAVVRVGGEVGLPLSLQLQEVLGALTGPAAYAASRRSGPGQP